MSGRLYGGGGYSPLLESVVNSLSIGGDDTSPMSFLKRYGAETCPGDIGDTTFGDIGDIGDATFRNNETWFLKLSLVKLIDVRLPTPPPN